MSTQQFFKLEYPFTSKQPKDCWYIFKLEQPTSTTITVDKEPIDLYYGQLWTMRNLDKNVGFIVNLPKLEHKLYSDTLISAPKATNIDDLEDEAEVYLTTRDFSVYLLADTVQFIAGRNPEIQQSFN